LWVWLHGVRVALPCVEFSTYAGRQSAPEAIKAALQFLDRGLRGFYCVFEESAPATVRVGDSVWAVLA
jgi:hypothetical protein